MKTYPCVFNIYDGKRRKRTRRIERQKRTALCVLKTYDGQRRRTDSTRQYLGTSTEEEQKPSTWEEYDEDEPFEEHDKDEPFKENDDEGKWTTQFSYPTEEEENTLFIAFMTGNVEDQKTWINAKMNLTRTQTNEEIRRREEEILDRIIPTEIMDLDETFEEEETNDLSECRPYDLTIDQEEDFVWKDYQVYSSSLSEQEKPDEFIDENTEEEDIQLLESLNISYQNHKRQDEETVNSLSLTTEPDEQLDKARYFTELDVHWKYNDKHTEDQWKINFKTNQRIFKPTVIFSRPYSPTTSQAKTDKISLDQKNERRIDIDDNSETKEQNTEYTRSVPR
jgi:hypothetical protein